ncbi:MAG: redoxin domain-containing protein [Bacteroidia bacterium]
MKKIIFLLTFLISCTSSPQIKKDETLFKIQLKDLQGNEISFSTLVQSKLTVVIFLSPQCPICQGYSITLKNLWQEFAKRDVHFTGIIPGADFTKADIENYHQSYKISFELLIDKQKELTHYLHATVTPQCFVIDSNGKILYSGKIDDYAVAPGVTKQQVTQHYLSDALTSILENKKVAIIKTEAAGCFIER